MLCYNALDLWFGFNIPYSLVDILYVACVLNFNSFLLLRVVHSPSWQLIFMLKYIIPNCNFKFCIQLYSRGLLKAKCLFPTEL